MRATFIAALASVPLAAGGAGQVFQLPQFPVPEVVQSDFGATRRVGLLWLMHGLQEGGVHGFVDVDMVDENYAMLRSTSLPSLSAWLEMASKGVGVDVSQARKGAYNGAAYARLLEVATSLAMLRSHGKPLAIPIGVMICKRTRDWGDLPGNGERDAYMLIATERGLLIYDPPTRQLCELSEFPNKTTVYKIQF